VSDIKIVIGADIKNLQSELAKAGGVTQEFANKATTSVGKIGATFTDISKKSSGALASIKEGILSTIGPSTLMTAGIIANANALLSLGTVWAKIVAKDFIGGLDKVAEAHRKAAEASKEYKKELDSIISSVAKEASRVVELVAVLNSETETRERKLGAIKELNKIAPETFGNLKLEGDAVNGLSAAYLQYIENLKLVISAKLLQADIEKKITKLLELQGLYQTKAQKEALLNFKKFIAEREALANSATPGAKLNIFEREDAELNGLNAEIKELTDRLENITGGIKIKPLIDPDGKSIKAIRSIQDVLDDLKDKQEFISKSNFLINTEKAQANISALKSAFDELLGKFRLSVTNPVIVKLAFEINKAESQQETDALLARTKKVIVERSVGKEIKPKIVVRPKLDIKIDKQLLEFQNLVASTVQSVAVETASSISEALVAVFSGNGFAIPDIFGRLISNVGSQIQNLGKFLIQSGIQIKIAKEAFSKLLANPIAAIAVGIGLVALGALLKAQASKNYKGFAGGSTAIGEGGVFEVGERGKELIRLPRGASVVPNHEVNAYGGGLVMEVTGRIVGEGTQLAIIIDRARATNGRNN